MTELQFDVAQLAHVEIFTPKPDATLWFFKEILGMEETKREGQSVYLRAYEEFYHHSLKITERNRPGLGHVAWRTSSPEALERRVAAVESFGLGRGWIDGDNGHGPAYQFTTPEGHKMELLWEVEYCEIPQGMRSALKSRPQKRPNRGVPVRRLDHVNLLCANPTPNRQFLMDQLGFRLREQILLRNGSELGAWMSVSPLVHEVACMRDARGIGGRLHHLCYWYGVPQHLSDAADLCAENGIKIEFGPGKHGVSQGYFMYVYEPGGNRVELFGDSGYLIFDPTWKPVVWQEEELDPAVVWYGSPVVPEAYFIYGTPNPTEEAAD